VDTIDSTIAARIRGERAVRRWSLDDLAERAGVSKAMISKIERGEASPTAALLGRLSGAFGLTLSAMLAEPEAPAHGPIRRADQPTWRDPATGYIRRQVAAPARFPVEMIEVSLPAGASVSFPAASYSFISQIVWVLTGRLTFVEGETTHALGPGDSLELGPPADCAFRNDGTAACSYLVVILRR
jgi:transcriptional regulator with XRE-family HTH domain